jgi:glycosyltransferase involved in cell wall biosynthesis
MATFPYFVLGPNAALSMLGLLRGPDKTVATPAEDWRRATVDVVIPALQEEATIVLCLASVLRQTLRPRRIMLIDDGSTDRTVACARAFCSFHGADLTVIQRRRPIGKTPTIKRQARELDSDVEFILDGDTVLESDNYIERTVEELYKAGGIASACGTILPMRQRDRRAAQSQATVESFARAEPWRLPIVQESRKQTFLRGITNLYREVLYLFLQRFVYHGQMVFFGTITNPVGCAVAYRRRYVKALFDHFSPELGDDLTNSEDIFIGMAMLNEGYRNVQLTDVYARTVEPELIRLPRQVYLWSSSFLQSCYYFDDLVKSPFRALKRWQQNRRRSGGARPRPALGRVPVPQLAADMALAPAGAGRAERGASLTARSAFPDISGISAMSAAGAAVAELVEIGAGPSPEVGASRSSNWDRRVIGEPYRQAWGRERTREYGRPAGWMLLTGATEKVFFPTAMLIMALTRNWEALAVTVVAESTIALLALVLVMKGQRVQYFFKGLAVAPIRYAMVGAELVTVGRFAADLWLTGNRKWRK